MSSTPSYHSSFQSPWMQHPHYNQAYNASSDQSYQYPQQNNIAPNWQLYDDGHYGTYPLNQQHKHSPQPDLRLHRRQNSNSTSGSYASIRSPYNHAAPLPYSASFDNTYLDPSCDYTGATHYQKHLPTPTHTPTPQDFMDSQRGYNRRTSGTAAAHNFPRQPNNGIAINEELPHTPRTSNGDHTEEQYHASNSVSRRVPNFDRTMSAIYQDELYDPAAIAPAPLPVQGPSHAAKPMTLANTGRPTVHEWVNAANEARSSKQASRKPVSRDPSPFRQGSPYAGQSHGYGPIGTAAGARQQQKAEADALAYQQHHPPLNHAQPSTISPKDAVIDYQEQPDDPIQGPPLFPQISNTSEGSNYDSVARGYGPLNGGRHQVASDYPTGTSFSFPTPSIPASAQGQGAADFKFNAPQFRPAPSEDSQDQEEYPAHLVSMESTKSEPEGESQSHDSDVERPTQTTADGGTYTCTYHGCSQRFATPALLQKHKREGHRASISDPSQAPQQSQSPGTPNSNAAAQLRNSQAGPHKCERINPSTGKPCNTIFSRPYDLTRHEDTIHAQRTKVRCQYCTEEKTFSRSDALTRHMRVVHPNIDFPGKHRRRHME